MELSRCKSWKDAALTGDWFDDRPPVRPHGQSNVSANFSPPEVQNRREEGI